MCGIAGFINLDKRKADIQLIDNMLAKLQHRGPDHTGSVAHKNIGLGATRLSILDLSESGNQPFYTDDKDGVLVYNGEVYNFRELRSELKKEGATFKSRCDTEVVLKALHHWGPEEAVTRFNGMFAFIYCDRRTDTLWLGRDPSGIKPLYVARNGNIIAFASELKALFEHPNISCRPDLHSITTYIMMTRLDRWTPFENVDELQPGTLLAIDEGRERSVSYFEPLDFFDKDRYQSTQRVDSFKKLTELQSLLSESIESHLVSDAPLAISCSGGVDSSLITHFASRKRNDLTAYVVDVDGMEGKEVKRARTVCGPIDVNLRTIPMNRSEYLRLWPKAIWSNDEPFYFQQTVLQMAVSETAHRDGFKVLLCGEGADELFGGYSWQSTAWEMWMKRRKRYRWLKHLHFLKPYIKRVLKTLTIIEFEELLKQPILSFGNMLPGDINWRSHAAIDGGQRYLRREEWMEKLKFLDKIEDRVFLMRTFEDFSVHLATSLKNNDKVSMAYSVESRIPFLDKRMIEFGFHLPRELKYDGNVSKFLLKKAAAEYLPEQLVYAKKIGFGFDFSHWQGTKTLLKDGIVSELLKWRPSHIDSQLSMMENDKSLEYHLICLEIWARLYLDGQSPDEISDKLMSYSQPAA